MKALVIGDGCIDEYRYGIVNRLNPEAPVPLLDLIKVESKQGMAWNVAKNLLAFGVEVETNIPYNNVSKKVRYVDNRSGRILLRVDEDVAPVPYRHQSYLGYDFILISDYDKGYLSYTDIEQVRKSFRGPIYLDTKKPDLARFEGIYLKINDLEFQRAKSVPSPNWLVVTNGAEGCFYHGNNYPASSIEVVDVCGAGDTFLAAFAYAHVATQNMDQSLKIANYCAGVACSHMGVYAISTEDVKCVF